MDAEQWLKDNVAGVVKEELMMAGMVKEELMNAEDRRFQAGAPEVMKPATDFQRAVLNAMPNPFQAVACHYVYEYITSRLDKSDEPITFPLDGVYVVWFTKVLQNWRCLISTTLPDQMYYEVTYDGDHSIVHLRPYKKAANFVFSEDPDMRLEYKGQPWSAAQQAKFLVMMYIKHETPGWAKGRRFKDNDIVALWLSEVMQNWKAVLVTHLTEELLYEITYNGDTGETYIDVYRKWTDISISEGEDSIA